MKNTLTFCFLLFSVFVLGVATIVLAMSNLFWRVFIDLPKVGWLESCKWVGQKWPIVLMSFYFVSFASAAEVNLLWGASTTAGCTYTIYATTNTTLTTTNMNQSPMVIDCGTNLSARVTGMTTPGTWRFGVTAKLGGVQSDLSNILVLVVPEKVDNLEVVVMQYSGTLQGLSNSPRSLFFRVLPGQ